MANPRLFTHISRMTMPCLWRKGEDGHLLRGEKGRIKEIMVNPSPSI